MEVTKKAPVHQGWRRELAVRLGAALGAKALWESILRLLDRCSWHQVGRRKSPPPYGSPRPRGADKVSLSAPRSVLRFRRYEPR